jgi:ERCC4-related helicase
MDYKEFILTKQQKPSQYGIEPNYYNDNLFDFQKHIVELAVKKGRCGVFLDTGLVKTLIQLTIAQNFVNHNKKRVFNNYSFSSCFSIC